MADASITIDLNLKGDKLKKNAQQAAETFADRIEKGLTEMVKKLGLGSFAPAGGKGGNQASMAAGVAAGLAAGGVVSLLGIIADTIKDFPMIAAIMKLFKVILLLLLYPLIPILKPVLLLLAGLAKALSKGVGATAKEGIAKSADAVMGGLITNAVALSSLLQQLGKWIWDAIVVGWEFLKNVGKWVFENVIIPGWELLMNVGSWIWNTILFPSFNFLVNAGIWIWSQIIQPSFNFLRSAGIWIWNQIIYPAFLFLKDAGRWIWGQIVEPSFNFLNKAGEWIWFDIIEPSFKFLTFAGVWIWQNIVEPAFSFLNEAGGWIWFTIIKPAFDFLSNAGQWIWNILVGPFDYLARVITDVVDSIAKIFGGGKKISKQDFVVTPSGVIESSPQDYIIGTKNPGAIGGGKGMTININIDKPTLMGNADIKTLVKSIEQEMYKYQRRYNSYA